MGESFLCLFIANILGKGKNLLFPVHFPVDTDQSYWLMVKRMGGRSSPIST